MLTRIIKKVEPPPEPTRIFDDKYDPDGLIIGLRDIPGICFTPVVLSQPNGCGSQCRFIWISLLDGNPVSSYFMDFQFAMMWALDELRHVYTCQYGNWDDIVEFINKFVIQTHIWKVQHE